MAKKKTNYEKKGIVRQLAGSIFASHREGPQDAKWRPRKKQFARLDADDQDSETNDVINRAFSTESETHDYRRDILFSRKKAVYEHSRSKKRDLSSITIKPSARDRVHARNTGTRSKKLKKEAVDDPFGINPFGLTNRPGESDESVDDSTSKHTSSTKHTTSTKSSAFYTVNSDPSDFFSKQPPKLTKGNLDLMESMREDDEIENVNPRSQFHQFTIEEDKESTVIIPVGYSENDYGANSDDEDLLEEDSQNSLGFTSKGTQIQKPRSLGRRAKSKTKIKDKTGFTNSFSNITDDNSFGILDKEFQDPFFPEFEAKNARDGFFETSAKTQTEPNNVPARNLKRRDPSQQYQSNHSLAYSESSCEENGESAVPFTTDAFAEIRERTQAMPDESQRTPLSPLNALQNRVRSGSKPGRSKTYAGAAREVALKKTKPDPDATWSAFPNPFDRRPDPKGTDSKTLSSWSQNTTANEHGESQHVMNDLMTNENAKRRQTEATEPLEQVLPAPFAPFDPLSFIHASSMTPNTLGMLPTNHSVERGIPEGKAVENEYAHGINGIDDFDPEYEYGYVKKETRKARPIGIQSFPTSKIVRSFSSSSSPSSKGKPEDSVSSSSRHRFRYGYSGGDHHSQSSRSRSYQDRNLCSHGLPKSRCCHIDDNEEDDDESIGKQSTSSNSFSKPLGLPNNAIMASMLFRRHHNIDAHVVDAKLKAREQEYKTDKSRGDIPTTVQAVDGYSCVSSFSEDTAAQIEAWRKPTRDLLDHFSRPRRTDFDFKRQLKEQREQATALFEA